MGAHIALEVVGLPRVDHVVLVRKAGPLVQVLPVVNVTDQGLALLGCLHRQGIHRDVDLGLGIIVALLVEAVVLQGHGARGQHQLGVVLGAGAPDVVAFLLLVGFLVLVLEMHREQKVLSSPGHSH